MGALLIEIADEPAAERVGGPVSGGDHQNRIVAGDCADDLGPFRLIERDSESIGASGRSSQHQQVLSHAHVAQELLDHGVDIAPVGLGGDSLLAVGGLNKAELPDVARKRHLRGRIPRVRSSPREFLLGVTRVAPHDIEDLRLPVPFVHARHPFSRASASSSAAATVCGTCAARISRVFIPSLGRKTREHLRRELGGEGDQLLGSPIRRLLPRADAFEHQPAQRSGGPDGTACPLRASASAISVATTQLSSAAAAGLAGRSFSRVDHHAGHLQRPRN